MPAVFPTAERDVLALAAVAAEATTRAAADTALTAAIASEASTRSTADTSESSARASADTTEATARANADALLIPLAQKGAASGVATLDGGSKIPAGQLPAFTVQTVWPVASQAAMLAVAGQIGDMALRSDITENFILAALPASTLANWVQLQVPAEAELVARKGQPSGYGSLDSGGHQPLGELSPTAVHGSAIPAATTGQVPISNGDGTWSPGAQTGGAATNLDGGNSGSTYTLVYDGGLS